MKNICFTFVIFFFFNCTKEEATANSATNLTANDKAAALKIHNDARADVGVAALQWSDALAADAAKWALNLAKQDRMYHSDNEQRSGQGENLYMTTATDREESGKNASQAWYDEIQLYTYSPIGSGQNNFSAIGHYTQMVWESTTQVGMALAVSKSGATYVVARYSPAGNYIGETPY